MEVAYLDLVAEGYMGSMQWLLGRELGTIPAFASRTQENQENLCQDGFLIITIFIDCNKYLLTAINIY
jgi:hypothetical protein